MALPPGIGIIDTMIGFPHGDTTELYKFLSAQTKDAEAKAFAMPAEYMFTDVPEVAMGDVADPVALTLAEMDRWDVAVGMVPVATPDGMGDRAVTEHPDRFVGSVSIDPNDTMGALRRIVDAHERLGARAVTFFPAGCNPQVPIDDRHAYPVYAKCVELGLPVFVCAGVPGPRVPFASQHVELLDQVCYDFPELVLVTRHGCEPWVDLVVKLMIKWPNLHYSTSAFAPRYYPRAILDYANTRGAEKVIYGGYFPMGLSLERIVGELGDLPLKDDVVPKFLRGNAARVLGLDA